MPAHGACAEPACSLDNSRIVLRRAAPWPRGDRVERWPYEFRLCERCQMGFVHPAPPAEVLACSYTSDYPYYAAAGRHPAHEASSWKYRLARLRYLPLVAPTAGNRARAMAAALVELLARKTFTLTLGLPLTLPTQARILDYGYGTGSWLIAMSLLGYSRLAGYDIAANAHRGEDLAAHGIQVIPPGGMALLDAGSFDCVRLEHVFEHLPDPLGALRQLAGLLRPAGFLLMTFPTIYPWLHIPDLPASPYLDHLQLPIHLAHHSIVSATRLVEAAGFTVVTLRITRRERFITLMARKDGSGDGTHPRH
jgi:SAM-dependent methyltransferase